ncbi:hypothetical protein [Loktanella sp. Alg231-35]|uniref:hypothetical protein n=1 Tax=Loktanella sp. Alg231-35 TaxID=1922220 RepID=UPI00131F3BC8|nr:hypothetical protein [Loktanella sp. Alg231-35]
MMKTTARQYRTSGQSGFAIIVVLSSLLILTILFAIASQRSMAHVQTQSAERYLAKQRHENAAILTILRDMGDEAASFDTLTLPVPFEGATVRLQDVGGLIDLNTASPELLERMFDVVGFPEDAARSVRDWKQDGQRFIRIDDVIRVTNADAILLDDMQFVATVHSGRRGIAPSVALDAVLEIAAVNDEAAPSMANFAVYRAGRQGERLIGVVNLGSSATQSRLLEMR